MPQILASEYNVIQNRVSSVLGLSTASWGATAIFSAPVTNKSRVTAHQWNMLIDDVNIISQHVQNTSTTTAFISTGTELVTPGPGVELEHISNILSQVPTRYTCHPEQFILDTSTSTVRPALFVTTSTRTEPWGLSPITIHHGITVSFITRLQAYYYFNLGNYLAWKPFYVPPEVAANDLDLEWMRWIEWINNSPELEFRYTRDQFMSNVDYTRVYTSGTLSITVLTTKRFDERNIDFSITYANEATTLLVVSPTVAGYTINI